MIRSINDKAVSVQNTEIRYCMCGQGIVLYGYVFSPSGSDSFLCVSLFMTLSHSHQNNTHLPAAEPQKKVVKIRRGKVDESSCYFHFSPLRRINRTTMAVWKAAFAALSIFAAVEGFMSPTVSRVSQPPRMTATVSESAVGGISTENIRNIAGVYSVVYLSIER